MSNSTVCINENNIVRLVGVLATPFEDSHVNHRIEFCKAQLRIKRLSGVEDLVPIVVNKSWLESRKVDVGMTLRVNGILKTHFKLDKYKCVQLYVFVNGYAIVPSNTPHENEVWLRAKMSQYREVHFRHTLSGKTVADFTVQQENRTNKHTFNFPCIAWGSCARWTAKVKPGTVLMIRGRLQSRTYDKQISKLESISIQTQEISVNKIEEVI